MHLKVFLKLKKPYNPLFWAKNPKKTPKNHKKKQKKTKKTHWAGLLKKKPGFFPTLL
jgi:hypothetical protein